MNRSKLLERAREKAARHNLVPSTDAARAFVKLLAEDAVELGYVDLSDYLDELETLEPSARETILRKHQTRMQRLLTKEVGKAGAERLQRGARRESDQAKARDLEISRAAIEIEGAMPVVAANPTEQSAMAEAVGADPGNPRLAAWTAIATRHPKLFLDNAPQDVQQEVAAYTEQLEERATLAERTHVPAKDEDDQTISVDATRLPMDQLKKAAKGQEFDPTPEGPGLSGEPLLIDDLTPEEAARIAKDLSDEELKAVAEEESGDYPVDLSVEDVERQRPQFKPRIDPGPNRSAWPSDTQ